MSKQQVTTTELKQSIDGLEQRFDGLEQRFDGMEQRFDGMEHSINELKDGMSFIQDFLMNHVLTREEAYATFATKAELFSFKSEILTAIDAIGVRQTTFDQEFTIVRSKSFDHEDRLNVIETKLEI